MRELLTSTGASGPAIARHQSEAAEKLSNGKILKGDVGSGKTRTAFLYHQRNHSSQDIYVITTAKKRDELDWEAEGALWAISTEAGLSFGGIALHVDSWNNIINYKEVKGAFFVFDEQRLVGSGAWVKAFYKIAAQNDWIMLSATPGDTWLDYIPVFVANGFYKNKTDFLRRHVVYSNFTKFPKIDRYVDTGILIRHRAAILVDMPFARHTRRHVTNRTVDHDPERFRRAFQDRWHVFDDRPIKDVGELFQVLRKIVNSDASRLGELMVLLEKHPKLIVFYNFDYELMALRNLCSSLGYEYAEWNGHKHESLPTGDKWLYLVQYTAGAEGWNCITTDAEVFFSLNYSWKINEQCKGRIDRMDTPFFDLYYYYLISNSWIDNAIHKALVLKRNFNEKTALERSN